MSTGVQRFDVVVVGAGPAGSVAASLLTRAGARVALLEAGIFQQPRMGESLAPDVCGVLGALGLWNDFERLKPSPSYESRSIWVDAVPRVRSHLTSPFERGWHVDRAALDGALARRAAAEGATLRLGTRVLACDRAGDWALHARGPKERIEMLRAAFVIDATGRRAVLARMLGAERLLFDRLVGVAALLGLEDASGQGFSMVEAVDSGWWYTAPAGRRRMAAVLFTDAEMVGSTGLRREADWRRVCERAPYSGERVGARAICWGPQVVSAVSQRLQRRTPMLPWLAVGDAALAVDPLTGRGVVRALSSGRDGAEAALTYLAGGGLADIAAFERARDVECTAYLRQRGDYYAMQQRFGDSPFWARRQQCVARRWPPEDLAAIQLPAGGEARGAQARS